MIDFRENAGNVTMSNIIVKGNSTALIDNGTPALLNLVFLRNVTKFLLQNFTVYDMSGTTIHRLTRIDNVVINDIAITSSNNEYVDQGLTFVEIENCNDVLMNDLYFSNINYDAAKGVYMWWYDQPNANIT